MSFSELGLLGRSNLHHPHATAAEGYCKLFEVAVQHGYYNRQEENACSDFTVYPNARTRAFMQKLGMVIRSHPAEFAVFLDKSRKETMERQLANAEGRVHLSFFLALKTPRFVNLTQIPFDLRPSAHNFYFRNDLTSVLEDKTGAVVRVFRQSEILPVKPTRFPVFFPKESQPKIFTASGESVDIAPLKPFETSKAGIRRALVDLSLSSEEAYRLDGASFEMDGPMMSEDSSSKPNFISSTAAPVPFALIDIFLSAPKAGESDVHPVQFVRGHAEIASCRYVVQFQPRCTRWVYHIVPRSAGVKFRSLKIENTSKDVPITFDGPEIKPNPRLIGPQCHQFTSRELLPFRENSDICLRLKGKLEGMDERVLVDRLPVASPDQVLRREPSDPAGTIFSDIYVYV